MSETIVIPFRGPDGAKSRLAATLDEPVRASLALGLFRHVLDEAIDAGIGPVLVVTPSSEAASLAQRRGADVLRETAGTLNGAVTLAARSLRASGASHMTVIAADLPLLEADDILALVGAPSLSTPGGGTCPAGFAIAPDHLGSGTNAMSLPVGQTQSTGLNGEFRFHYGHKSLAAHRQQATRLGLATALVDRRGLAADLDEPGDLDLLGESFVRLPSEVRRAIAQARGRSDL